MKSKALFTILLFALANNSHAANLSVLESCASKSISQLANLSVVTTRKSSTGAEIVMAESAYDTVTLSEKSGGDMYDNLALALSIAKMCWAEKDNSSKGIRVDIVTQSGLLIVSGR